VRAAVDEEIWILNNNDILKINRECGERNGWKNDTNIRGWIKSVMKINYWENGTENNW